MRLDKFLSSMGLGSRKDVRKLVKAGRITVNGMTAASADMKVDEENDIITADEIPVVYRRYAYYMLNKPAGYISASSGIHTVMELIDENDRGLFPCGRLDRDTEGLLLITNDGPLAHNLLSPAKHVGKEYLVRTEKAITEDDLKRFEDGIEIDGGEKCRPAAGYLTDPRTCMLTIREGRYHQVKRMFEAVGNHVVYLKRIRMKNLVLDEDLKPGEYRPLTKEEEEELRADRI